MLFGNLGHGGGGRLQRTPRSGLKEVGASSKAVRPGVRLHRRSCSSDRLIHRQRQRTRSFIAAFDTRTGKQNWRVDREERRTGRHPSCGRTPADRDRDHGSGQVRSYRSLGPSAVGSARHVDLDDSDAVRRAWDGVCQLGVSGNDHRPVYAIRPGAVRRYLARARADQQRLHRLVPTPCRFSYNPSAIVYGDYYYTLLDRGILLCHDARTGTEVYGRQRGRGQCDLHRVAVGL